MVNPGGTNEKFAKEKLPKATLLIHPKNAEIPALVADGKADVMITETMEARRCVRDDSRLAAPLIDKPFTENHFGILMMRQEDEADHPINGDARCEAGCGGSRLCATRCEPASGVRGLISGSVEHAISQRAT